MKHRFLKNVPDGIYHILPSDYPSSPRLCKGKYWYYVKCGRKLCCSTKSYHDAMVAALAVKCSHEDDIFVAICAFRVELIEKFGCPYF